jgi:pantoate--beta-alanine ligase
MPTIDVARTLKDLRQKVAAWKKAGETVAIVPTMGALHEGHLQLVRIAQRQAKRAIVSIFVNPTQFAPHEDFDRYPRDENSDLSKLALVGCDLVWAPDKEAMYQEGFATRIAPAGAAEGLETDFRPGFFNGVATVCCKLFMQSHADFAIFGEKDYQQLCVVQQMARDLNLPVEIVGAATVRESDGLAMSSRNRYLTPEQRALAPRVHQVITAVAKGAAAGNAAPAIAEGRQALEAAGFRIDYLEVRDARTLRPIEAGFSGPRRVLVAAWLDKTRLIDNVAV